MIAALMVLLATAIAADGPEVSRSVGNKGEVVVLWPRVIPQTEDPQILGIATEVQTLLAGLATQLGQVPDIRPQPQRVCPRAGGGCKVPTLSALIAHQQGGCAIIGLVGATGEGGSEVLGWVGHVQVRERTVPFRVPPENGVRIVDFAPCDQVIASLPERADVLTDSLRAALANSE